MNGMSSAEKPIKTSFFYGWVIVALGGVGLFFSGPGQTYSISVFIDFYIRDFGWSRSLVSGIYSGATLLAGLLLFLVGRSIDSFGQRKMSVIIGGLLGLACLFSSVVLNPFMLFISFFMLRLFGQGSMTLLPNTLIPQWFILKRGRALSFMAIGGFLSAAILPPLNAWLITSFNWRITWLVWSLLLLLVFVPLAYKFIRNKPEDIGLDPDNQGNMQTKSKFGNETTIAEQDWTLQEAVRTKAFWLVLLCVGIPSMVNTGLTFHLVSILGENGLKTTTAALILSIMAFIGFPVTLVSGFILEKIKVHYILALVFFGEIVFLLLIFLTKSLFFAIVFGVVWGIVGGFERIALSIVWPNYFGRKYLGSIKGVAMTSTVIGSAFGPLPFGIAYDYYGGYTEILFFMLIFPCLGIIAALFSPPPKYIK